jgi:hypothetical protein
MGLTVEILEGYGIALILVLFLAAPLALIAAVSLGQSEWDSFGDQ